MKIIENNHDKFPLRVRCYNCNSLIEVESEEELSQTELCEKMSIFGLVPVAICVTYYKLMIYENK